MAASEVKFRATDSGGAARNRTSLHAEARPAPAGCPAPDSYHIPGAEAQAAPARRIPPRVAQPFLVAGLVLIDAIVLMLVVTGGSLAWHAVGAFVSGAEPVMSGRQLLVALLAVPVMLLLFRVHGLYDLDRILVGAREYASIAHATTYGVVIVLAASYFAGGQPLVSRSWLLYLWAGSIGAVGLARFGGRRLVRRLRRHGILRTRVVIVGASTYGVAIAEQLSAARDEGIDVLGFLDEYLPLGERLLGTIGVIGRPSDFAAEALVGLVDEYVVVSQAIPHQRLEELTRVMVAGQGPKIRVAVSSLELLTNGVLVAERGCVPLVTLHRARITGLEALLKRAFDLLGATLALACLGPPALVALGRGMLAGVHPAFQRWCIFGGAGEPTVLWLLDRRVSSWLPVRGAPALLAVLTGRMSLVGPRPLDCTRYDSPPAGMTAVRPGLTGPWRLSGAEASLLDQATRDLAYVRNCTIWEDVRILWATMRRFQSERRAGGLGRWESHPQHAVAHECGTDCHLL